MPDKVPDYLKREMQKSGLTKIDELLELTSKRRGDSSDELRHMQEMQAAAKKYQANPATEYECKTCNGIGWLSSGSSNPQDKSFGRLIACTNPHCPRQSEYKRNRAAILMSKYDDMPAEYRNLSFETFAALHHKQRQNKELAVAAARYLANNPKRGFSLSDVLATMTTVKDVETLEPDFDSDDEQDYVSRVTFIDLNPGVDDNGNQLKPQRVTMPDSYGSSLILSSPKKGVGKTGIAVAAYNALVESGVAVAFVHFPTLLDRVRATYHKNYNGDSLDDILLPVRDAEVLVLDEFGVVEGRRASDHTIRITQDHIVTPRFNAHHSKPIIATTNHTQKSFVAQFDELASSRVFKMAHFIHVGGMILRHFNYSTKG